MLKLWEGLGYYSRARNLHKTARIIVEEMNGRFPSNYDDIIKKESERIGWDWRLLASLIYQESRFNPQAESWAGAYGLMQLMPGTARNYGITKTSPPAAQIRAGTSFIKWLDNRFIDEIIDPDERHIQDARRLAELYGEDPNIWYGCVEAWLLKKADPQYYNDEVVKHGYARGIETYNFVKEVIGRFEHYKNIVNSDVMAVSKPVPELH